MSIEERMGEKKSEITIDLQPFFFLNLYQIYIDKGQYVQRAKLFNAL
jgi:hypothetical protein